MQSNVLQSVSLVRIMAGCYRVGEISGPYHYESGQVLPHRRPVRWLDIAIDRSEMSSALRNSAGSIGAVCNISDYAEEIKKERIDKE